MFKWLKSIFVGKDVPKVVNDVVKEDPAPTQKLSDTAAVKGKNEQKAKKPTQKGKTKKSNVDLSSMTKNDLLNHAKKNGVKANASMKKADILAAIKNA